MKYFIWSILFLSVAIFFYSCDQDTLVNPFSVYTYQDSIVQLVSPEDGFTTPANSDVRLTWRKTVKASNYELCIDTDPNFATAGYEVIDDTTDLGHYFIPNTFYWRIRVHNSTVPFPGWSETRRFIVQ
ncbi:MAG: hypothetical protein EHM58_04230 [Ignavibacteriae bacterium]|nr:MAG: hypothetical protein EHM58_04230 [Ignavibacteriota bacterium]